MVEKIAKREKIGDVLAEGVRRAAEKLGKGAEKFALHVKGEEVPAHDPRVKGHLTLGYTLSSIGADHIRVAHDGAFTPFTPGWVPYFAERVKPLGIIEPLELTSIDHKKIRRFRYFQNVFSMQDTLNLCLFAFLPAFYLTLRELVDLVLEPLLAGRPVYGSF